MTRKGLEVVAQTRWIDVDRIKYWGKNPNEGDIGAIMTSIQTFGWIGTVYIWQNNELRGGNHSIKALRKLMSSGWLPWGSDLKISKAGKVQIRFSDISHMTRKQADAFGMALNRINRRGRDDMDIVASIMADIMDDPALMRATGYELEDVSDYMVDFKPIEVEPIGEVDLDGSDPHEGEMLAILGTVFPSESNDWGIPDLPLDAQATELVDPVTKWGVMGREDEMLGTYHFYTHDYKFAGLVSTPDKLLTSGCQVACEVNASTYPGMPPAIFLSELYVKRWLACYWAAAGVKILVDLNVEPEFDDWNLIGVPDEWKAYCTRFIGGDLDHVQRCYEIGCDIGGTDDILFVVFGGTHQVKDLCHEQGWTHVPEHSALVRGFE